MLHEIAFQIQQDITIPHIIVAIIIGFIGRISWGIANRIWKMTTKEVIVVEHKLTKKKLRGIDLARPLAEADSPWLFE